MSYLYRFGQFVLDPKRRALSCNNSPVPLTPKAFEILVFLAQNPNRVITKDELLKAVWADTFVEEGNLTQNISLLRKALADKSEDNGLIVTITRKGYQFTADVTLADVAAENRQAATAVATFDVSTTGLTLAQKGNHGAEASTVPDSPRVEPVVPQPESHWRVTLVVSMVALVLVFATYISWRRFRSAPLPKSEKMMLAVLPFQNLTGDPKQEYLADGLTEELIARLGRLQPEQLGVIARTSVMGYKHSDKRLDQIGRDLSVQYLLENSFQRSGERLRITVQLVQVKDQSHLWTHDYDYVPGDVLGLEDDVGAAVAREIQLRLTPPQQADVTHLRPVNSEAFDAYLRGRYFFDRSSSKEDLDRATSYYERAIKLDSTYALAWVGLSKVSERQADKGLVPNQEGYRRARETVEHAVALDPNLAEAHSQMGWIKMLHDWDWTGAEASFQRALALAPGNSAVVSDLSSIYATLGRLDTVLELDRRAVELDPLNALSRGVMAQDYYYLGRQEEAAKDLAAALELDPGLPHVHQLLGLVYLAEARPTEALAEIEREPSAPWRLQGEVLAYHALGRRNEAKTALTEYIAKYQEAMAYEIAEVYAYRRETDQAFEWLDRAYAQRDGGLASIKADPLLRSLHGDPRYAALLVKMRLPA